ncbi:MAG: SIS domain-containing protein [Ktedonobacteraceae bacterium]|nr:SIS domain-containing protein [Ktedonobacteraceae bacterium]
MYNDIQQYWHELMFAMQEMPFPVLNQFAELLLDCQKRNSTIFLLGNGGSAATASHFACDLTKGTRTRDDIPAFRAITLNENVALMTAWANDTTYERIFAEQLSALVRPHDVVILISVSGNSPNILAAAVAARRSDALVIALTGQSGGSLMPLADLAICVPTQSIEQVEDAHLIIAHSLCVVLRKRLDDVIKEGKVLTYGEA